MPQNAFNGDIHGVYPAFHVQSGDKFQTIVNCAYGATSCYVTFGLDYHDWERSDKHAYGPGGKNMKGCITGRI